MKPRKGFLLFSFMKEFSRGETTRLAYLFVEAGVLLDLDPLGKQGSQISWAYFPLWGEVYSLQLKSKPAKTDSVTPNKGSSKPFAILEDWLWL